MNKINKDNKLDKRTLIFNTFYIKPIQEIPTFNLLTKYENNVYAIPSFRFFYKNFDYVKEMLENLLYYNPSLTCKSFIYANRNVVARPFKMLTDNPYTFAKRLQFFGCLVNPYVYYKDFPGFFEISNNNLYSNLKLGIYLTCKNFSPYLVNNKEKYLIKSILDKVIESCLLL